MSSPWRGASGPTTTCSRHTSGTQDHGNLTTSTVATSGGDYPGWEWGFSADTSTAPPNAATTASTSALTPGTSRPAPSTSSPKYSTSQTNSAPRRPPRDVVEPSSGRRGSPTATKTGSCGVGDLQCARHDPAPLAVTRAIPPPCTHRAYDRRLRGAASKPLRTLIVIIIYYRHFTIYAGGGPPADAGAIIPRREDFTMATHSTPHSRSAAVDDVDPEELHPRNHHSGFEAYQS